AKSIQSFVQWTRAASQEFLEAEAAEAASQLLASNYRLTGIAVLAWLSGVRWSCKCEVRRSDLTAALQHLSAASLMKDPQPLTHPAKNIAKAFCEVLEAEMREAEGTPTSEDVLVVEAEMREVEGGELSP
ncbi:unnamed protein product, partial [Effrenium voratum]